MVVELAVEMVDQELLLLKNHVVPQALVLMVCGVWKSNIQKL